MRILHILAQLPARTGSGIYYQNLIRELGRYDHEQRALFACQGDTMFDFLPPEQQYPVEFCTDALPFPIAGMSDIMPYASTVYHAMDPAQLALWKDAFQAALTRANQLFQPDVVCLHHLWILSSMAAEVFSSAVKIGICHNTDLRQAMEHPGMKRQHAGSLHKLDRVFALNNGQKKPIETLYGIPSEKITVLGGGFDQDLFYPGMHRRSNDRIELVYASKIDPAKGIYALLDAFQAISKAKPHVHLTVIGTPDEENTMRLQPYLAQNPAITCLPAMEQAALADMFRTMDLFVMPSFFEGLGLTALEALACGLRVVAAENQGLVDLLGHCIRETGAIEYVPLPRMASVDKPCRSDLPDFTRRLTMRLFCQIERIERGEPIPSHVFTELEQSSWQGIASLANGEMNRLVQSPDRERAGRLEAAAVHRI